MSKSLGNVMLIRDALKDYSTQELRWYFASFHYREPVIMSKVFSQKGTIRVSSFSRNIEALPQQPTSQAGLQRVGRLDQLTRKLEHDFRRQMDDDFYTPGASKSLSTYAAQVSKMARRTERSMIILGNELKTYVAD